MMSQRLESGLLHVAEPTEFSQRLVGLDVLRGFALFGVFLVNAMVSSRSLSEAMQPPILVAGADHDWWQLMAWAVFDGLLVTKFVAIFSLLFGMGLVLQHERAESKGLLFATLYRRRLAILAAIGLVHGCILFEGDILLVYAIVGAILFVFRNNSARTLGRMALIPFAIGLLLSLGWATLQSLAQASETVGIDVWLESELHDATFLNALTIRPFEFLGWLVLSSLLSFNCRIVASFFAGAAIMKSGWARPHYVKLQRNVGLVGMGLGLCLEGLSIFWSIIDSHSLGTLLAKSVCDEVGSVFLAFGYTGVILWAVHAGFLPIFARGLAAVGRTALTNYLLQSVILNIAFMAFALDLYGKLSRAQVLGWFSLVFVTQIFASVIWLRSFSMGPAEYIWRRLTYRGRNA